MGNDFSTDLYNLIMGKMASSEFRKNWGAVAYDASTAIINVGENTIITNMDW